MGFTEALAIAACLLSAIWAPPRRDIADCPLAVPTEPTVCPANNPLVVCEEPTALVCEQPTTYVWHLVGVSTAALLLAAVACKLVCDRRRVIVGRPVIRGPVAAPRSVDRPQPAVRRRQAGPIGHLAVSAHLL